jgi:hypothetical protein
MAALELCVGLVAPRIGEEKSKAAHEVRIRPAQFRSPRCGQLLNQRGLVEISEIPSWPLRCTGGKSQAYRIFPNVLAFFGRLSDTTAHIQLSGLIKLNNSNQPQNKPATKTKNTKTERY